MLGPLSGGFFFDSHCTLAYFIIYFTA